MKRVIGAFTMMTLLGACTAATGQVPSPSPAPFRASASSARDPSSSGTILFGMNGALYTVDPDGHHEEIVDLGNLSEVCCGRWSPNGDQILFPGATDDDRITTAIVDADGSNLKLLPIQLPGLNLAGGVWSPTVTRIASQGWDEEDPSRNGLYTSAIDGSDVVRLTTNRLGSSRQQGADVPGAYAPDGTRIAFSRYDPTRGTRLGSSAVFIVDIDGSHLHRLTDWLPGPMSATADWSPDGTQIAYDYVDFDERNFKKHYTGEIFVINVDGTRDHQVRIQVPDGVTSEPAYFARQPSWSPDGSSLVFTMWPGWGSGDNELFTMRADGSDLHQVTSGGDGEHEWADWKE